MTGKRRAMRQSVPAKAQKTEAPRLHPAKQREKIVGPKRKDAEVRRPTASASRALRDLETGGGEGEIQRSRPARP